MSFNADRLYELLPAIYRIRDAEQGEPLKAFLSVIAEQIGIVEEDLEQLYDDQFIETCAEWVVPYIGDLIGYRSLYGVAPKVGNPRAEVAHTIGFRRRKGTAAMLEQLARDVTGWNARVVEFFQLLAWTQHMNHIRPRHWYAPDLRTWEPLECINTPFDALAHTVDVRRIATGNGLYNIPNIGVFLWRLTAYALTNSPAVKVDDRRFLFSPLGRDMPLFTHPDGEDEITHLAEPINVPMPISRRVLDAYRPLYYGPQRSVFLRANGGDIDVTRIEACDLSDAGGSWAHQPLDTIAIDPVLGRLTFPQNHPPPADVRVTFHYGFSADMGGGQYDRTESLDATLQPVETAPSPHGTIQDALNAVVAGGSVEITDSGRYPEVLTITVNAGRRLELRAANEHRPTIILSGDVEIRGGADSEVTLNGLLIAGALRVTSGSGNQLRRLTLRHCTLVPGSQPSLITDVADLTVEIDRCIMGGLRVSGNAQIVIIADSIIDAGSETSVAFAEPTGTGPGGTLHIENSTLVGKMRTVELELMSNVIVMADLAPGDLWTAPVRSEKKQAGCVRFSYLPLSSVVPRRYRCQPVQETEALRVRPQFTSLRYGDPGYGQLALRTAVEIRTGADDESEMGAFHALYQPQRETNVKIRLEEYLRFGLEAGVFFVT
jgi:hypothetical protein